MGYSKSEYTAAMMWYFGMSKRQAENSVEQRLKDSRTNFLNEIVYAYKTNAKKAFYND